MAKVLNVVFGIGVGVVVYIIILLGIQAFYPAPEHNDFCNETRFESPIKLDRCLDNMTVGECRELNFEEDTKRDVCYEEYDLAQEKYNKNFFIIGSILGVLVVVAAYFLLSLTNISAGIGMAGFVLILWAFMRSWESINDMLKFIVGLFIAAIVISLAVIVNKKLSKK